MIRESLGSKAQNRSQEEGLYLNEVLWEVLFWHLCYVKAVLI